MDTIFSAFAQAGRLILAADPALVSVTLLSLQVTLTAVAVAALIGMPLGAWLAISRFRFRRTVIGVLNGLMGLPPVVVGLILYLLLSRMGPLGSLGLLFSPTAMIIAQVIIVTPIIASLAHQALRELWAEYRDLLLSLRATKAQQVGTLIVDGRRALLTAGLTGFGRAIGEVGAIIIVGGNIEGVTRVLTTAITLETARGDFALALALGIVLLALAIAVNLSLHAIARTERESRW
jgi:tungstate transport system permease protein